MESTSAKFELIQRTLRDEDNRLSVTALCNIAGVSRSGYYNWVASEATRIAREHQDERDFERILTAYRFRGYDKGIRGIHMKELSYNPNLIR